MKWYNTYMYKALDSINDATKVETTPDPDPTSRQMSMLSVFNIKILEENVSYCYIYILHKNDYMDYNISDYSIQCCKILYFQHLCFVIHEKDKERDTQHKL